MPLALVRQFINAKCCYVFIIFQGMKTQITEAVNLRVQEATNEIDIVYRGSITLPGERSEKVPLYWASWADVDNANEDGRSTTSLNTEQLRNRYRRN